MKSNADREVTRTVRVAAVQMESRNGCIAENLARAALLVEQASKEGAQLALLPELMSTGYLLAEGIWEAAEHADGPTVAWLKANSKRLHMFLGTSFLEADGDDFFNTFALADPQGEVSGRIRKRSPAVWEAYFFKGEPSSHAIDTALGKIGVGICYDNEKAAVAEAMSRQSVDLVLMPHSRPVSSGSSGIFSKENMIRGQERIAPLYASLLGVPVVLANKCGPWESPIPGPQLVKLSGSAFTGRSMIIDSDCSIKGRLGEEEGVIVADVTLDPARKRHPVLPHYGRYVTPGPPQRVLVRLVESMGQLSYAANSKRKGRARSMSRP